MTFLDRKRNDLQTWTDERVELLKKLWGDGLSASQIAGELGGITRNAVIGKVHRLGLSGRAKAPSSSMPRPRKPRPATQMFRAPQRPMMRGNTALATMPSYDYDPEPEPEVLPPLARTMEAASPSPAAASEAAAVTLLPQNQLPVVEPVPELNIEPMPQPSASASRAEVQGGLMDEVVSTYTTTSASGTATAYFHVEIPAPAPPPPRRQPTPGR